MLPQRLKQLRTDKSINQIQLAQEMGVNQGTVGKWETGTRKPDAKTLEKLADYFAVTVDYLLGRDGDNPEIILLARKLEPLPESDRDFLLDNFNNTIDAYLKSRGH
ncbi:MAG: helix-turn-helix domain-containing protein [Oscillospiraceae bacterium]|nr:helix-turn-helix domain-containing protein [Oscillospiraceae bacterium]